MARDLDNDFNELKLHDNISDSQIVLYYREPTTEERMAYANESVQRKRNKVVTRVPETRVKFGAMILTGFREGDFIFKKDGVKVPMSADASSPNYYPDWKSHIQRKASDLLMILAAHVFDTSAEAEPGDIDAGEEEAGKN